MIPIYSPMNGVCCSSHTKFHTIYVTHKKTVNTNFQFIWYNICKIFRDASMSLTINLRYSLQQKVLLPFFEVFHFIYSVLLLLWTILIWLDDNWSFYCLLSSPVVIVFVLARSLISLLLPVAHVFPRGERERERYFPDIFCAFKT